MMSTSKVCVFAAASLLLVGSGGHSMVFAADSEQEVRYLKAQVKLLTRQNTKLRDSLAKATDQIEALSKEVKRLKGLLDKAGISPPPPGRDLPKSASPAPTTQPKNGNVAFAKAISEYKAAWLKIHAADHTDVRETQLWLAACKKLDDTISKLTIVITLRVEDVSFAKGTAHLDLRSGVLERPGSEDMVFPSLHHMRIRATEAEAGKISKSSVVTITGTPRICVDFTQPLERHPAISTPRGCTWIGRIGGFPSSRYDTSFLGIALKRSSMVVKIDGVKRSPPL